VLDDTAPCCRVVVTCPASDVLREHVHGGVGVGATHRGGREVKEACAATRMDCTPGQRWRCERLNHEHVFLDGVFFARVTQTLLSFLLATDVLRQCCHRAVGLGAAHLVAAQ
jgi:hypothetical protein